MVPLYEIRKVPTGCPIVAIKKSQDAADFALNFYGEDIEVYESFFILMVNQANVTIGYAKISQGGVTGTIVDTKIVAKYCVGSLATGVILIHNHPSGNLKPSQCDIELTTKLKEMGRYIDCRVLDHIILAPGGGYYSMMDSGYI
jgi:DNA repair protein RadC